MEMTEIANLIVNGGVTIVVIAYFMYIYLKFMTDLQSTLASLQATMGSLVDIVKDLQSTVNELQNLKKEEK